MKGIVWGGLGLVVGGVVGFVLGLGYGRKDALKRVDEMLDDVGEEFKRDYSKEVKEKAVYSEKEETSENEERKKAEKRNQTGRVNYQAKYEEAKESDGEEVSEEEEWIEEHKKEMNDKIRIISFEDADELPEYYKREELFYWTDDEIVSIGDSSDGGEVVTDPELLIGDALDRYGFKDNDEQIIFVRNPKLATLYEVNKVRAAWADSIDQ